MTTYKLARWFSGHGHCVSVFSFEMEGHIQQGFARLLVPYEIGGVGNTNNIASLTDALASVRPDVVINQMPYEHAISDALCRQKSYLLIGCLRNSLYSVRNNIDSYALNVLPRIAVPAFRNPWGRRILWSLHKRRHSKDLRTILDTYDRFVMFGPPNLEELREFVPRYDRDRTALIPNSVPTVLDSVPTKEKRILWLGRLDYQQKRADLILPLWEALASALPDWRLDVVGSGPVIEEVKRRFTDNGIERVTFHGQQEPATYFRRASIFVMTSAYEGFPNTLIEAQSYACIPVVFDSYPIASWMIDHGKNGFLEQPFDVVAMSQRIIKIIRSGNARILMSNSLENAKRFSIDKVGPMWLALFKASLGDSHEG